MVNDTKIMQNPLEISADEDNKYIMEISHKLQDCQGKSRLDPIKIMLIKPPLIDFSFKQVSLDEVRDIIFNLKTSNICDIHGLWTGQEKPESIMSPFKGSKNGPIKKREENDFGSYRPKSIISVFSKNIETAMLIGMADLFSPISVFMDPIQSLWLRNPFSYNSKADQVQYSHIWENEHIMSRLQWNWSEKRTPEVAVLQGFIRRPLLFLICTNGIFGRHELRVFAVDKIIRQRWMLGRSQNQELLHTFNYQRTVLL